MEVRMLAGEHALPPILESMQHVGLPSNVYSPARVAREVKKLMSTFKNDVRQFFNTSMCVVHSVNSIPPKPQPDRDEHPNLWRRCRSGRDGLGTFFPAKVHDENIGSNDGLMAILRVMFDEVMDKPPMDRTMRVVVSDCNIFARIMKVCC